MANHLETVRTFIAIDINRAVRGELAKLQLRLKRAHAHARWVKPENIHLTLAFLGDVDIDQIRPLEAAMDEHLQGLEKFSLILAGTGSFGKPRRPRIIWAGINDSPPLMELQRKTTDALLDAGIDFDTKPFSPHLTMGRVKSPKQGSALLDGLEMEEATGFGRVEISEVLLFKSVLKPGGAEYSVLYRVPFVRE